MNKKSSQYRQRIEHARNELQSTYSDLVKRFPALIHEGILPSKFEDRINLCIRVKIIENILNEKSLSNEQIMATTLLIGYRFNIIIFDKNLRNRLGLYNGRRSYNTAILRIAFTAFSPTKNKLYIAHTHGSVFIKAETESVNAWLEKIRSCLRIKTNRGEAYNNVRTITTAALSLLNVYDREDLVMEFAKQYQEPPSIEAILKACRSLRKEELIKILAGVSNYLIEE